MTAPILLSMSDAEEAIKKRLDELGISQTQFSTRVGRSSSWASAQFLPNVEKALVNLATRDPNVFQRILDLLGWSVASLQENTGIELPKYLLLELEPGERVTPEGFRVSTAIPSLSRPQSNRLCPDAQTKVEVTPDQSILFDPTAFIQKVYVNWRSYAPKPCTQEAQKSFYRRTFEHFWAV